MEPFSPNSKIKKNTGNFGSHLTTFQGDIIRNSRTLTMKVIPFLLRNKNQIAESSPNTAKKQIILPQKLRVPRNNLNFLLKAPVLNLRKISLNLTLLQTRN